MDSITPLILQDTAPWRQSESQFCGFAVSSCRRIRHRRDGRRDL